MVFWAGVPSAKAECPRLNVEKMRKLRLLKGRAIANLTILSFSMDESEATISTH